jgi:hypothetical protein
MVNRLNPHPDSWKLIYFDAHTPGPIYLGSIRVEMTTVARLLVVRTDILVASQSWCFHWGANVGRCADEVK